MAYADTTTVKISQSREDIEVMLARHGATAFAYASDSQQAAVRFDIAGRRIEFRIPVKGYDDPAFRLSPERRTVRKPAAHRTAYEQHLRQRWRALFLVIKARLEAIEAGIETLDEAFLAHLVLPQGGTVGEHIVPRLDEAYAGADLPELTA